MPAGVELVRAAQAPDGLVAVHIVGRLGVPEHLHDSPVPSEVDADVGVHGLMVQRREC
jgi:hypothetical protein